MLTLGARLRSTDDGIIERENYAKICRLEINNFPWSFTLALRVMPGLHESRDSVLQAELDTCTHLFN